MISGHTKPLHDIISSIIERSCDSITVGDEKIEHDPKTVEYFG